MTSRYIIGGKRIRSKKVDLDMARITTNQGANVALGRLINAGVVQKVRQGRHFIYQLK